MRRPQAAAGTLRARTRPSRASLHALVPFCDPRRSRHRSHQAPLHRFRLASGVGGEKWAATSEKGDRNVQIVGQTSQPVRPDFLPSRALAQWYNCASTKYG
eukprot:6987167-Pyramimonas_sp.AAC.1